MTTEEILRLEAGIELDRAVGILIIGLPDIQLKDAKCPYCGSEMRWCGTRSNCPEHSWIYSPYRDYSTDMSDAWKVVKAIEARGHCIMISSPGAITNDWHIQVNTRKRVFIERAETAELGICRAALQSVILSPQQTDGGRT